MCYVYCLSEKHMEPVNHICLSIIPPSLSSLYCSHFHTYAYTGAQTCCSGSSSLFFFSWRIRHWQDSLCVCVWIGETDVSELILYCAASLCYRHRLPHSWFASTHTSADLGFLDWDAATCLNVSVLVSDMFQHVRFLIELKQKCVFVCIWVCWLIKFLSPFLSFSYTLCSKTV